MVINLEVWTLQFYWFFFIDWFTQYSRWEIITQILYGYFSLFFHKQKLLSGCLWSSERWAYQNTFIYLKNLYLLAKNKFVCLLFITSFRKSQKQGPVFICPLKKNRCIIAWSCLSIHLSINNFSCMLHNAVTTRHIFMQF